MEKELIKVQIAIQASIIEVWNYWTGPTHITQWNFANEDWCCPKAKNDLKPGGRFNWRMESKNGEMGFDFSGTYEQVTPYEIIQKKLDDERMVRIRFSHQDEITTLTETFEAEKMNSIELQRTGWQSILNNFKRYVEQMHVNQN